MLHSTRGIVLHSLRYSETSIIVKIYTELFGIRSYLVRGIRKTGSKIKNALFQPLTLLDLVVNQKEHASLQNIREARVAIPYQSTPFDIRKSSVALFINELIYKAIKEEEPNRALFSYLWENCLALDQSVTPVNDFHLRFAIRFMHPLGIFPRLNHSVYNRFFNMREGLFQPAIPEHPEYLGEEESLKLAVYLALAGEAEGLEENFPAQVAGKKEKQELLEIILKYYQLHLPGFRGIRSHLVLQEVFG